MGGARCHWAIPTVGSILAVLMASSCGSGGSPVSSSALWEEPADPVLPAASAMGEWPPGAGAELRYLDTRVELGPAEELAEGLLVPTGFGLTWLPRDGTESREMDTPGWARATVAVRDDVIWIADGHAGLSRARLGPTTLEYLDSHRLGCVRDVERAGSWILAVVAEGLLLTLEVGDDGEPIERDRTILDGMPTDVAVVETGEQVRWAVATVAGGLTTGRLDRDGRLEVTGRERTRWARCVGWRASGPVALSATTILWGSGLEGRELTMPSVPAGMARGESGTLWIAAAESGVFVLSPDSLAEPGVLRQRPGVLARAVAPAPTGGGPYVSWSDGVIERLDTTGAVLETWIAGAGGRVVQVTPGFVAHGYGSDLSRVVVLATGESFDIPAEVYELSPHPEGVLVAAQSEGALAITGDDKGHVMKSIHSGHTAGIARAPDGSIWISDEQEGLVHLPTGDAPPSVYPSWSRTSVVALAVSGRWAVTGSYFGDDLLAIPTAPQGGPPVRASLAGRPWSIVLRGDDAVVGMPLRGVDVVPLDQGDWPEARPLQLPFSTDATTLELGLCPTADGVLAMLHEVGIAVVQVPEQGPPVLKRLIDTPGRAVDCAPGLEPNTWLIADTTGLLELRLEK